MHPTTPKRSDAPRHHRGVAALAVVALAASLAAVPAATAQPHGNKVAGLGISRPGVPQQLTNLELARMRRMGVNHVMIDVWWDFDRPNSSTRHPGAKTITDVDLGVAIDRARAAGAAVIVNPKVWCPSCLVTDGYTWRGRLRPGNRAAFFASYRRMLNHYAEVARDHGAAMYFIGSEMAELEDDTGEWRRAAAEVRARFPGRISYQVNWDAFDRVRFWDAVDVVSVSAYFPLSDEARPSVDELKAGWKASRANRFRNQRWFDEVADLARDTRKPLLFAEAGYVSATYAAREPYDPDRAGAADGQVQANAYQALLETFQAQPWWLGVVWWEWYISPRGGADASYTPRDKPAEAFLGRWYNGR